MMNEYLYPSCRVAFAALIHDIGKFAERAKIDISPEQREGNIHTCCPFNNQYQKHTHIHAAYTGIAIDAIERFLPAIKGDADMAPFQKEDTDDSIITAAAKHHKPDSYLQKIISVADCLSSAFERSAYEKYNATEDSENYQVSRLIPLFDKLSTEKDKRENHTPEMLKYRYPLKPLSPEAIFPVPRSDMTKKQATEEYRALWDAFVEDVKKIHDRENWDLYLDHFDTLYSVYTQNIPSATAFGAIADVSLYDHSKSTAALATALWRYHKETDTETKKALNDKDTKKFLLVQGDVSGIQGFIFDVGKHTRKNAYKLLRGRSFLISLLSECAALKVLQELGLPSTSQIMNAAGKFVIVAPNTPASVEKIEAIKKELNTWFLKRYYGELSLGLATIEASQADFEAKQFKTLQEKIFQSLGKAKLQKFDLCKANAGVMKAFAEHYDKEKGLCCFDGRMPAETEAVSFDREEDDASAAYSCQTCKDILQLGENLTSRNHICISSAPVENGWKSDIFGFHIGWKKTDDMLRYWDISLPKSGSHQSFVKDGVRYYDISRPENESTAVFNGQARRYINAYVPRDDNGDIKTFSDLAKINRLPKPDEKDVYIGKSAVMTIKGDIDDLGSLLQSGIKTPTFATLAGLSRQLNNFFTIYLPWLCQNKKEAKNIYTVFAGGDDFYLIGPWLDQIRIVPTLRQKFKEYVCNRDDITFSIGMCMTGSGEDVVTMSEMADDALEKAKKYPNKDVPTKNAVCCFGQTVSFADYDNLMALEHRLDDMKNDYDLSTGYIYSLQTLCDQAERAADPKHFNDAMWRSKLVYKTVRFAEMSKKISEDDKQTVADKIAKEIGDAVATYKTNYKIALFTWLYQQREEKDGTISE
ncbi:MAG: type III-A CRISPR-associated protein Cas10/Csm1 [Alphaproteobacteria bacterium]|nr:type III-A CRISPR-associated protein Cas10/Csm1 [Alphaproteobacteria bacterium]